MWEAAAQLSRCHVSLHMRVSLVQNFGLFWEQCGLKRTKKYLLKLLHEIQPPETC